MRVESSEIARVVDSLNQRERDLADRLLDELCGMTIGDFEPTAADKLFLELLEERMALSGKYPLGLALDFLAVAAQCAEIDDDFEPISDNDGTDSIFAKYPLLTRGGRANTLTLSCNGSKVGIRKFENLVKSTFHQMGRTSYPSNEPYATGMWSKHDALLIRAFQLPKEQVRQTAAAVFLYGLSILASFDVLKGVPHSTPFCYLLENFQRASDGENAGMTFQGMAFGFMHTTNSDLTYIVSSVRTGSRRQRRIGDIDFYWGDALLITCEVKDIDIDSGNFDVQLSQFQELGRSSGCLSIVICSSVSREVRKRHETESFQFLTMEQMIAASTRFNIRASETAIRAMQFFVSSIEQSPKGISRLNSFIEEFAVSDEDVFVDDGVSASIHLWDRPAGKALKSHIHAEGIRHIIAVKIDRLFRDVPDLLTTVDELRKEEIDLHLLEYNGATLDTSSAMGRFFLTVIGGIAELELGQVSERTKFAIEYKKSNCKAFTGAIYGWDRDGDDLAPNWEEQSFIDYMRDLYFGWGMSAYWIAKELNDYGETGKLGGKWRSSNVLRTIRYEFHEERGKFEKPEWWKKAPFHDTVPWGTTEFLDLYPEP